MADVDANVASGQPKRRTFRKFSFRDVDLDHLLDMSTDELVKLFTAHARRRFQRGLKRKPKALIKKLRKAYSHSHYISSTIKHKLDIEAYNWKSVTSISNDYYWKEFKKKYQWDQNIEVVVKTAWENKDLKSRIHMRGAFGMIFRKSTRILRIILGSSWTMMIMMKGGVKGVEVGFYGGEFNQAYAGFHWPTSP